MMSLLPASSNRRPPPLAKLRDMLPTGTLLRNVSVLAGGTAVGQAIAIIASPVLARLYSPEHFGLLGIFASLLGVLTVIASLRYEFAIPLEKEDKNAACLVLLSLMLIPATTLALALVLVFFRSDFAKWTNSPELHRYLWLLPLAVTFSGIYQVLNYWAIRKFYFGGVAGSRLIQSTTGTLTQMTLFSFGALGLLLGQVLGILAGTISLAKTAFQRDRESFIATNPTSVVRLAKRYRRFPQLSTLSGIINSSGLALPTLLLAALFGPVVAGQFALVQRVVAWPVTLVGNAFAQVYLGESTKILRSLPSNLLPLFVRASCQLVVLSVAPTVLIIAIGPWLFPKAFGCDWVEAGQFSRLLAPMIALQLVVRPVSQTLITLERQTWQLAWDILRFCLTIAAFFFAAHFAFSPANTISIYALAMTISYLLLWFLQLAAILNHKKPKVRENYP